MTTLNVNGTYYYLRQYGTEWEWQSMSNPDDGYGPFNSKQEALDFGNKMGTVH